MKQRDAKSGKFIKKERLLEEEEDVDVTFPLKTKKIDTQVLYEKIKKKLQKDMLQTTNEFQAKMKKIDESFDAHIKMQRIIDYLFVGGIILWCGYILGIISIIIFK
jgi:hypothetical protein